MEISPHRLLVEILSVFYVHQTLLLIVKNSFFALLLAALSVFIVDDPSRGGNGIDPELNLNCRVKNVGMAFAAQLFSTHFLHLFKIVFANRIIVRYLSSEHTTCIIKRAIGNEIKPSFPVTAAFLWCSGTHGIYSENYCSASRSHHRALKCQCHWLYLVSHSEPFF